MNKTFCLFNSSNKLFRISGLTLVCLLTTLFPTVNSWDVSLTYGGLIANETLRGIDFYQEQGAINCTNAVYKVVNQGYLVEVNVTQAGGLEKAFSTLDPYLNITSMLSDSVSSTVVDCPVPWYHYGVNVVNHFD